MTYEYQRPEGELYKTPIHKWNNTFAHRGRKYLMTAEIYLQEDCATVHYVINPLGKTIMWLLAPIHYLIMSFMYGYADAHRGFKSAVFDKQTGSFGADMVYKRQEASWNKLMHLIGK